MSGNRWLVYGYAIGDPCMRSTRCRNLPAALWRWFRWRTGGVQWDVLHLPKRESLPTRQQTEESET